MPRFDLDQKIGKKNPAPDLESPLRIITGHAGSELRCRLFPRKQTLIRANRTSAQGHNRTNGGHAFLRRRVRHDLLQRIASRIDSNIWPPLCARPRGFEFISESEQRALVTRSGGKLNSQRETVDVPAEGH